MQPVPQDIQVFQGDNYDFFFRVRNAVYNSVTQTYSAGTYVVLTGYTGKAQIRATPTATALLAEFAVIIPDQTLTPGGVLATLTPVQTAALPSAGGVWDLQLTNGTGEVRTFVAGKVIVTQEVTRVG